MFTLSNKLISIGKISLITLVLILTISYLYILYNFKDIKDNWTRYKCVPYYSPFAGFIQPVPGENKFVTGMKNVNKCLWVFSKRYFSLLIKPVTYILSIITTILNKIKKTLDTFREQLIVIRKMLMQIVKEVMERLENLLLIFLHTFFKLRDTVKKSLATFKLFTYMLQTSSATLQSFINGPVGDVAKMGATLGYMMTYFLLGPVSFGMFPSLWLPVLCFSPDTRVKDNYGNLIKINKIKIGDTLFNKQKVTAVYRFLNLSGKQRVIENDYISDNHIVFCPITKRWTTVDKLFPKSENKNIKKPSYLCCLSVTGNKIYTEHNIYRDWDEIDDNSLEIKYKNKIGYILNGKSWYWNINHTYPNVFYFKKDSLIHKINLGEKYGTNIIIGKSIYFNKDIIWYKHNYIDNFYTSGSNIVQNKDGDWIPVYQSKDFRKINFRKHIGIHFVTLTGTFNINNIIFRDMLEVRNKEYETNYLNVIISKLNYN